MKTSNAIFLILLVSLLNLSSCSAPQSTAELKITSGFGITNPHFGGGLIVYGENLGSGKKFSFAIDTGLQKSILLDNGTWNFYAVGWDGDSGNTTKFGGQKYCGSVTQNINGTLLVDIPVTTAHCTNAGFMSNIRLHPFRSISCQSFYEYNLTTNSFSPIAPPSTSDTYCSILPQGLNQTLPYYRIFAMDKVGEVKIPRFKSACINAAGENGYYSIPIGKIPLSIRAYKSLADCNALSTKFQIFDFPNGIIAGDPARFDHQVYTSGITSSDIAKLYLPASFSRRARSPFMSMMPRILCGSDATTSDCFYEPSLPYHSDVNWQPGFDSNKGQVVYRDTDALTCNAVSLFSTSKFFGAESCELDRGQLFAKVHRNELSCQQIPAAYQDAKDIYAKNDKIYVLMDYAVNNEVLVYTQKGKFLHKIILSGTGYNKIAVTSDGDVIAGKVAGTTIERWDYNFGNETYSLLPATYGLTTSTLADLEVGANNFVFAGRQDGNLEIINWNSTPSNHETYYLVGSNNPILQMKYKPGYLYHTSQDAVYKTPITLGWNVGAAPTEIIPSNDVVNFDIDDTYLYAIAGSGNIRTFNNTTYALVDGTLPTSISPASGMYVKNQKVYITHSTLGLQVFEYTPATMTQISDHDGQCLETVSIASGSGAAKNIIFRTNYDPSVLSIFDEGLRLIGLRQFADQEKPFYLFESLDHDKNGGGRLEKAARMMGPEGIGGALSDFASCNAVVTAAPFSRTIALVEPFEQDTATFTVNVAADAASMENFVCTDADPAEAACVTNYDLTINFTFASSDKTERGRMRLKCSRKLGSFESIETETGAQDRSLFYWNTALSAFARFEEYSLDRGNYGFWSHIVKFQKTADDEFWSREVEFGQESNTRGFIKEFHRNATNLMMSSYHLSHDTSSFFSETGVLSYGEGFDLIRGDVGFGTNGRVAFNCMGIGNNNPDTSNIGGCTFSSSIDMTTSRGVLLDLNYYSDLGSTLSSYNSSNIKSKFALPD